MSLSFFRHRVAGSELAVAPFAIENYELKFLELTFGGGLKALAGEDGFTVDLTKTKNKGMRRLRFSKISNWNQMNLRLTWISWGNSGGWSSIWNRGSWLISEVVLLSGTVVGVNVGSLVFGFSSHGK